MVEEPGIVERSPAPESPAAALERREQLAEVRRLVLELPEAQREALWLRCVDGLSLAEVARVLRRSEDAVKGLLRRAKSAVLAGFDRNEDCAASAASASQNSFAS